MVTRCPIVVQMTCPPGATAHSATISTQRSADDQEEGIPGQGGAISGPGSTPTESELTAWGARIQQRTTPCIIYLSRICFSLLPSAPNYTST
eukprot:COSAG04_NODE_4357_length_2139_cov_2.075000_4_plen_91_part_01